VTRDQAARLLDAVGISRRRRANPEKGTAAEDAQSRRNALSGEILAANGLRKRFGQREVVCGIDLWVAPGEVVGLLGPNGAGKTTTFNLIVGGLAPNGGRVMLGKREITHLPMYRRARLGITYLPQEPSIFRRLSVRDNVNAILETVESNSEVRSDRLRELLEELGLSDKAHQRGDSLSGGERRRVEITRALVLEPRFMLLDEPFSGIDPIAVIDIQKIIEHLRLRGIGLVITDHNVRETLSICDRAYIIKDGFIVREGEPREIASDPCVREIYLGENFRLS
jgi:lipopolysaccharide export system ATP-binding protein